MNRSRPRRISTWSWSAGLSSALSSCLLLGCTGEISAPDDADAPNISIGGNGQVYVQAGNGNWVPAGGNVGTGGTSSKPGGSGGPSSPATPGAGTGSVGSGGSSAPSTPSDPSLPTTPGQASPLTLDGAPVYSRFVRLTNEQWERTVQDLLALPAPPNMAQNFEGTVSGATDFTNNEHGLTVSNRMWEDYQLSAEKLAAQVTADPQALARIYPGDDANGFIASFGRRAYRRPLTQEETQRYQALFTAGTKTSGTASEFAKGAALVIRAMLQSPNFVYRTELGDDRQALSGFEVASKLSFWLRGTMPTDELLDAAEQGRLDTADGAVAEAERMLAEPAAAEVMRAFHGELLHFARYQNISKVGVPSYTEALNAEFEESSYLFFDRIFREGLGVRDILTSTIGFVGPNMAPLYGMQTSGSGFQERDLGPERVGYFTQLPYLTLYAVNNTPDIIHRGVDLNLNVLCATTGTPVEVPPIPPQQAGQTNRERINNLTQGCGGECHNSYINPIGFAFESFDGMGQIRDTDNGQPVDTSSQYPFAEGIKSFNGAAELMRIMAEGSQAHACYAKKLSSFALQRDIVETDRPLLETLKTTSMAANGSIKQVILELVKQPAFRTRIGGAQ